MAEQANKLRRRDFLKAGVAGLAGLAALKVGARVLWGAAPGPAPLPLSRLHHLSARQEAIVTAVALAMVGPAAAPAYIAGDWDPAGHVDNVMSGLAPDQAQALGLGIHLLEEWTLGVTGFSRLSTENQVAFLAGWRTSSLALKRTVWGALHAATVSSFSAVDAGSKGLMGHPGPCLGTGRPPGQTVQFEWDEAVP